MSGEEKRSPRVGNGRKPRHSEGGITEKTKLERLARCEELLHECLPHGVICRRLSAEWEVHPRTVTNYITAVYEVWREQAEKEGPHRREQARERMLAIANECRRAGELPAAVRALSELARMDGAYAAEEHKVEHSGAIAVTDAVPTEAVKSRIAELVKKRPPSGG